ncbi:hypothetical protein Bca52824_095031 [Brassica carinata]|uniref:Uncharacterized protein n=1 Tax=Brassica carinata TaxID=52824 RepID=A0A8X7NZN0_BRACI|nr:hypothetical protein Bca52824_095031 [Brassica carinata]
MKHQKRSMTGSAIVSMPITKFQRSVSAWSYHRETDERGRNYCVCKDFKSDGLHIRHDCLAALEEELDCLRSQYAEEVSLMRELQLELANRKEIKELKQLIML